MREYRKNRYHKMPKEKKQRLKGYQKNYREGKKSQHNNQETSFGCVCCDLCSLNILPKIKA